MQNLQKIYAFLCLLVLLVLIACGGTEIAPENVFQEGTVSSSSRDNTNVQVPTTPTSPIEPSSSSSVYDPGYPVTSPGSDSANTPTDTIFSFYSLTIRFEALEPDTTKWLSTEPNYADSIAKYLQCPEIVSLSDSASVAWDLENGTLKWTQLRMKYILGTQTHTLIPYFYPEENRFKLNFPSTNPVLLVEVTFEPVGNCSLKVIDIKYLAGTAAEDLNPVAILEKGYVKNP
jgi:hypothetical protein